MEHFEHGGDIYAHPGMIDFSASLNPLGIPLPAKKLLREQVDAFSAYPDPACGELTMALAVFEQVDASWVLPCAGASDAFARLCQALRPQRVLVCTPSYTGYEQAAEQVGAAVSFHRLRAEADYDVGDDLPAAISPETRMVFLANPNNPTGLSLRRDVLCACLERVREVGALLVLDECFVDLTQGPRSTSLLAQHPELVIVKALTKTYALAGLRVGYLLSADATLMERLRRAGQPWAVSVPAQLAGVACVRDEDYLIRSRQLIGSERARLHDALSSKGWQVVSGQANYLLFRAHEALGSQFAERGILVRSCANFSGLDARWYRIAVSARAENDWFIAALDGVVA